MSVDDGSFDGRGKALRRALIGAPIFAVGLLVFLLGENWIEAHFGPGDSYSRRHGFRGLVGLFIAGPMLVGYWMVVGGLWAAIMGARGERASAGWSIARIAFGVVATIGFVALALMVYGAAMRR